MIRLFENTEPMPYEQILDLLIRLMEYGELAPSDIEYRDGDRAWDFYVVTPWGEVGFSFYEEENYEFEGEKTWRYDMIFERDNYSVSVECEGRGRDYDSIEFLDYVEVKNIWKE